MHSEGAKPTVSEVLEDGVLVELVYDPEARTTALAIGFPNGAMELRSEYTPRDGERLIPYSAQNNLIATGCVRLPSAIGVFTTKAALLGEIQTYLRRYVDLSPLYEEIAAHYILLSWVYDTFNEMPYLRFRGQFGTGKTRALTIIGAVCCRPFFASGASTLSPIFHVLEAFRGTLVLDEADFRLSDATADLTKIFNNGTTKGMPVLRTMTNRHRELNPQAFRVFGPKIIGMRERFADAALESRFLTEETGGRPLRSDIPIALPSAAHEEAQRLRNKLLAWRFQFGRPREGVAPLPPDGLSHRAQQMLLPLLSLVDDPDLRGAIAEQVWSEHAAMPTAPALSWETVMISAVVEVFAQSANGMAPLSNITERFNAQAVFELGQSMPNRWVGSFLRSRLQLKTVKSHGVSVLPPEARPQVRALAARFGVASEADQPVTA